MKWRPFLSGRLSVMYVYVGSITRADRNFPVANGPGISWLAFDESTGRLELLGTTTAIENPSFLTISMDARFLYATSEVYDSYEGVVGAYEIEPNGELGSLNQQSTLGNLPCF